MTLLEERLVSAEEAAVGAALISPAALADVAATITSADVYEPKLQLVWDAAVFLYEHGQPADPITVVAELQRRGELARAGGHPYVHTLIARVPTAANGSYYARIVRGEAVRRRVATAGQKITLLAAAGSDPAELLEEAEQALRAAAPTAGQDTGHKLGDLVLPMVEDLETGTGPDGVQTGYLNLDLILNPLQAGQLVVVGARPSVGKSLMGLDLARYCAIRTGEPAGIASCEMTRQEITMRALSAEARVPLTALQRRQLDDEDWERIARAHQRIKDAPLVIDDTDVQTVASIHTLVRRHRLRLLIVDYLQLVTMNPKLGRREGIEEATRGFKLLAKAEQCTVVLLSQLNRRGLDRRDPRPDMGDLRESGSIEADADVVLLLHRPAEPDRTGELEVDVAKQRNGPVGVAHLAAQTHYARFADLATGWTT